MTPRKARELIKEAENFAKHARDDAEENHEYDNLKAVTHLFLAVAAHTNLTGIWNPHDLRSLFAFWYGIHFPDAYVPRRETLQTAEQRVRVEELKTLSRREFLNQVAEEFVGNPPRPD
jgi:hypothetical protein